MEGASAEETVAGVAGMVVVEGASAEETVVGVAVMVSEEDGDLSKEHGRLRLQVRMQ